MDTKEIRSTQNPLIEDYIERTLHKHPSRVTWHKSENTEDQEDRLEEGHRTPWENANFLAWLIREYKFREKLEPHTEAGKDNILEQSQTLAARVFNTLLATCSKEAVDKFRQEMLDDTKYEWNDLSNMFKNMLHDYWEEVETENWMERPAVHRSNSTGNVPQGAAPEKQGRTARRSGRRAVSPRDRAISRRRSSTGGVDSRTMSTTASSKVQNLSPPIRLKRADNYGKRK